MNKSVHTDETMTLTGEIMSLYGPLRAIFIPVEFGFLDPSEFLRAIAISHFRLSPKDAEILECLAQGLSNAKIAQRLNVADENTVKNRMKSLFRKLSVNNRYHAGTFAVLFGFGSRLAFLSQPSVESQSRRRR
jgi:DNA-binding CsgD family transcriptional regulator